MKNTLTLLVLSLLVIAVIPAVLATDVGVGVGIDIVTEDFPPMVWMCDSRIVYDDSTEPGRFFTNTTACPDLDGDSVPDCELLERVNNYAFEGEQVQWTVLVMDKNGIQKVSDVYATIGPSQGEGNDIEANCVRLTDAADGDPLEESCNARISEEELDVFDDSTMAYYQCTLTVETADSMYGEYWVTVEAEDLDGLLGTMDENEYWFFNPIIALSIDGDLTFDEVRPGISAYSSTLLVGNDAEESSGVLMDMFISGTDFYDSSSSGAACPTTNQLLLGDGDSDCDLGTNFGGTLLPGAGFNEGNGDAFCYFATHGAYSSEDDDRNDAEGYVGINYGIGFNNPNPFYGFFNGDSDGYELIQDDSIGATAPYFAGNVVSPGSEVAVTFRLNLPEPCNGDFDTGSIYFWGEAI